MRSVKRFLNYLGRAIARIRGHRDGDSHEPVLVVPAVTAAPKHHHTPP